MHRVLRFLAQTKISLGPVALISILLYSARWYYRDAALTGLLGFVLPFDNCHTSRELYLAMQRALAMLLSYLAATTST